MTIEFELLKDGKLPKKGTAQSAGYDVFAYTDFVIAPGNRASISLGFKCAIPFGFYGQLKPRSGFALKNQVTVDAGVIDADYRGVVHILLVNHSEKDFFCCDKGVRVGQIIFKKYENNCNFKVVEKLSTNTDRGSGSFGSTGF